MTEDRLTAMLKLQHQLQTSAYGHKIDDFSQFQRVEFIKTMVLAATDELHEALNETSWKPWSSTLGEVNEDAYFGELIDVLHFIMNLLLVAFPGTSPEELAALIESRYVAKRELNVKRQEEGYDGKSSKCPNCKRALDDSATECFYDRGDNTFWCNEVEDWYEADGTVAV